MIHVVNVSAIQAAPYNPRIIDEKPFEMLKESLIELGVIMPILVNLKNNTLIAGHQRTRAMKEIGFETAPAVLINGVELGDEIKFNQLHNAIEREPSTLGSCIVTGDGFDTISHKNFNIPESNAVYVREICNLILKYGNALSCIVCDGTVYMGNNYVKACKLLNLDVITYHLPSDSLPAFKRYFSATYGEYNYDGIERETFVQGLAQLPRKLNRTDGKKEFRSILYENFVMPYLSDKDKQTTVLDFGCGKATYINMLSNQYNAIGLEFFNTNGHEIKVDKGHAMIDRLITQLKLQPNFDVIICDSVLNSVDSQKAENSILDCLNLFCKIGGKLFISARTYESMIKRLNEKKNTDSTKRYIEFLDSNGLSANYRKGKWYFQKYHKKDQIEKLLTDAGFKIERCDTISRGFYIVAEKERDLPKDRYIDAINFEFNLPLPHKTTYNRHIDIVEVLGLGDSK